MPAYLRGAIAFCIIMVLGSLSTGCTVMYYVPKQPVYLPKVDQIHMTVALCLSPTLCDAKWEKYHMGDHYILPIGGALCVNAEAVARAAFTDVKIVRDNAPSPILNVDAILIPTLAAIERDRPLTIYGIQTTSILFTWSLNDERGQPIWVTRIAGEGKGPMGSPLLESSGRKQVEQVLNDVFQKSLQEMSTSPAIREFEANRRQSD